MSPITVYSALAGSVVGAYICFDLVAHRKILGGNRVVSMAPKWKEAAELRMLNVEREGSPDNPIIMNPFRRGVLATIKNKDDFPDLES